MSYRCKQFLLGALFALAPLAHGADARDAVLVSPAWLAEHVHERDLVLLHVGTPDDFAAEHIAGARQLTMRDIAAPESGGKSLSLELGTPEQLREQLAALGVGDTSQVVVYFGKDWVSPSTRVMLTLDAAGLGARAHLLDGGLPAWKGSGQAVTAAATPARRGTLSKFDIKPVTVDAAFVQAHKGTPGYALIDARSPVFYDGVETGGMIGSRHKTGHITGAGSLPFNTVTDADLKLKSPEQLSAMFAAAGAKPGDTIIAYCHIGQQATAVVFAARSLGYKAVLYDGSFEDWSRRDLPVETTTAKR